ncbi:hypothetical protein ACFWWS_25960 [Streptomyces sp. NPDC059083]|uniref:hypothetical protein n=1 Tax=unclassified Streptomyces TaxID=2593676 RepID=UPI00369ECDEF
MSGVSGPNRTNPVRHLSRLPGTNRVRDHSRLPGTNPVRDHSPLPDINRVRDHSRVGRARDRISRTVRPSALTEGGARCAYC